MNFGDRKYQRRLNSRRMGATTYCGFLRDSLIQAGRNASLPAPGFPLVYPMPRFPAFPFIVFAALSLLSSGCHRRTASSRGAQDDEAMVIARKQGRTAEQAALDFTPRQVDNYFAGMDRVALPAGGPNPADEVWPDQLRDRQPSYGPAKVADLLTQDEKLDPQLADDRYKKLRESEILGRNTWMMWCAGNEGFWDWLANNSLGFTDLLKVIDSSHRSTRFRDVGLINEPNMKQTATPGPSDFGLRLDAPADEGRRQWRDDYLKKAFSSPAEVAVPKSYAASQALPGSYADKPMAGSGDTYADELTGKAYDLNLPPPKIYGLSSGVIGLRLFPNPKFIESKEAQKKWDPVRFYNDPSYYNNPSLIRPFRVGMSCAFCHASFHPLSPPRDIVNPQWANLSGNIGAQYLRVGMVFGNLLRKDNFVYHLLESQVAGTIDTSLIASDNINNANAMNAVFGVPQRVVRSFELPQEQLSPVSASRPSLWYDPVVEAPKAYLDLIKNLPASNDNPRFVPRVLLDGADSVGAWVALARVFLNIGSYYEQWITLHEPLIGFKPQSPFKIDDSKAHSVYWHATERRVGPLRDYFLKITPPMPLSAAADNGGSLKTIDRNAPVDEAALKAKSEIEHADLKTLLAAERAQRVDVSKLAQGRQVFAKNCIVCHSSIQPESIGAASLATTLPPVDGKKPEAGVPLEQTQFDRIATKRKDKLAEWAKAGEFWDHDPGQWLSDPDYQAWALAVIKQPKFWQGNYLSTDYRIPINIIRTNAGRAMATNGMTGNMWQDYSSESYRRLPNVGAIDFFNPYLGKDGGADQFYPRHKVRTPAGQPPIPEGGGGPGFYRPASLISVWATAPFLHNNSLGLFNNDPSVEGRLLSFDDSIRKLLWPAKRRESSSYNEATPERLKRDHGLIWRTTEVTYLDLPGGHVPQILSKLPSLSKIVNLKMKYPRLGRIHPLWKPSAVLFVLAFLFFTLIPSRGLARWLGYLSIILALFLGILLYLVNGSLGNVRIGPIPKGTPVNLLANLNPDAKDLPKTVAFVLGKLAEIESQHLDEAAAQKVLKEQIAPRLMKVSKCPDFVMDHGHYFGWFKTMSDADKDALIELLKTF